MSGRDRVDGVENEGEDRRKGDRERGGRESLHCRFDAVTSIPVSWLDWGLDQVLVLFNFSLDRGISPLSFLSAFCWSCGRLVWSSCRRHNLILKERTFGSRLVDASIETGIYIG